MTIISSLRAKQQNALIVVHALLEQDLPEVPVITLAYNDCRASLQISHHQRSDDELRDDIAQWAAYLNGAVTEDRSLDDSYTSLEARGAVNGVLVRVYAHIDNAVEAKGVSA